MDDSIFTASRFKILTEIAKGKKSATELAKVVNFSLPYILAQLAILEAKNIITKEVAQSQKNPGKPKQYYSLTKPIINVSMLTFGFGGKFSIDDNQEVENQFRILAGIEPKYHCAISEYYWNFNKSFQHVQALAKLKVEDNKIELVAITEKKHLELLRKEISSHKLICNKAESNIAIACWVHSINEFKDGCLRQDHYYLDLKKRMRALFDKNNSIQTIKAL